MLTPPAACRRFREAFDPSTRSVDDHRRECEDCTTWATRVTATVAASATASTPALPPSLAARLRAIPRHEVVCRDVDRMTRAARAQAQDETPESAVLEHWAGCARCRAVYAALSVTMAARPPKLSAGIRRSVRQVARDHVVLPFVPRILRELDWRWAAAASLLVGLLLQPLSGDAATATRTLRLRAESTVADWVAQGSARRQAWWQAVEESSARGREAFGQRADAYGETWKKLYQRTRRVVTDEASNLIATMSSLRGDDHE